MIIVDRTHGRVSGRLISVSRPTSDQNRHGQRVSFPIREAGSAVYEVLHQIGDEASLMRPTVSARNLVVTAS
ncbi:hypothetical protein Tco_0204125 [Tanacetum coccineum]